MRPRHLSRGGCPAPVRATLLAARSSFAGECQPDPRRPEGAVSHRPLDNACISPARSTASARAADIWRTGGWPRSSRPTFLGPGARAPPPAPTRMRARRGPTTRGAARNALASSASRRAASRESSVARTHHRGELSRDANAGRARARPRGIQARSVTPSGRTGGGSHCWVNVTRTGPLGQISRRATCRFRSPRTGAAPRAGPARLQGDDPIYGHAARRQ